MKHFDYAVIARNYAPGMLIIFREKEVRGVNPIRGLYIRDFIALITPLCAAWDSIVLLMMAYDAYMN